MNKKANEHLEDRRRLGPLALALIPAISAALITSGTSVAAAYALSPSVSDASAVRRTMRLKIKSKHWGFLRLVVGTLETTFVIPPDLDLDGKFSVVLYNKNDDRTSRIFAEYTGFPMDDALEGNSKEKADGITVLYEFATKVDAYVEIDHTKPIPIVLMSANRDDIDDWGNG